VGNVAIGFDILGFCVDALGDKVTVTRKEKPGVTISAIRGVVDDLPLEPEKNTAGRALLALYETLKPSFGFEMEIEKGIPLGSGLGGSAASAVGAVVAANARDVRPRWLAATIPGLGLPGASVSEPASVEAGTPARGMASGVDSPGPDRAGAFPPGVGGPRMESGGRRKAAEV
jgi:homoserine kinase